MTNLDWTIVPLKAVLALLASDPEAQLAHLSKGPAPAGIDELALELGDFLPVVPQLVDEGIMPREVALKVQQLKCQFDSMSDDLSRWSEEAVRSSPEWKAIRDIANDALTAWA